MNIISPDYDAIRAHKQMLGGEWIGRRWQSDWCNDCLLERNPATYKCKECCEGASLPTPNKPKVIRRRKSA